MKPSAYISEGGILFKESPPDSILKLSPLYTSAEIQALHNLVKEQQAEIESLKKDLALKTRDRDVFANFTLAYEKRIEELEKGTGWLEETDEQVIANAEKRFPFLKKASEK